MKNQLAWMKTSLAKVAVGAMMLAAGFAANTAQATVLVGWDFSPITTSAWGASPYAAATTDTSVTIGGLTRGSGLTTSGTTAAGAWGGTGFSTTANTEALAITANNYVTFSITVKSGYTVSLTDIAAYNIRRSNTGPGTSQWQYQINSGAFTDISSGNNGGPLTLSTTSSSGNSESAITLSGISALQNLPAGTVVTFRIVSWGASNTSGTWYFKDLGNTTANDLIVDGTATQTAATPPTLTAASGATVDNNVVITFTDDATWRTAVGSGTVKYGSTTLTANTDYTLAAGTLTLKPSGGNAALQTAGTQTVTVSATGYTDATVSQAIGAGAATKLGITTQPTARGNGSSGSALATQPVVAVQDQYGNTVTGSSASIAAAAVQGTWTLGGTTPKTASSGVATFTDLTATSAGAVSGATITFTTTGLSQNTVTSSGFNISAPPTAFTAGNLAVLQADSGASQNSTITILELNNSTANQSSAVNTIPINATGANPFRTSGSAGTTGGLANSSDGSLLAFTGEADPSSATANENTITTRAVASLSVNDTLNVAATYTGTTGNQTRIAASPDNSTWYIGDQNGVYLNGASSPASGVVNVRSLRTFGTSIYELTAAANPIISSVSANGATLTGLTGLGADSKAVDFYMVSSGNNGTYDTLYYLVQTSGTSGTIKKYSLVSGTWTANGTYTTQNSAGTGVGGDSICAALDGSGGVYLYITSADGATTANSVYKFHDTAGYNATINVTTANNVLLYTAASGTILKGIAFAPQKATPAFSGLSASQSISYGTASITLAGKVSAAVNGVTDYPANGETVTITINGSAQTTTINDATGDFSKTFTTPTIPYSASAYTITYAYAGNNTTLNAAANDTSTTLTVNKATLTYTANAASMTYGGTVPSLSGNVTGFVNSENQAGATTGTLAFTTSATSSSPAGSYAINGSGLTAANYTFAQAAGNATALTINKATPTVSVGNSPVTYNGSAQAATVNGSVSGTVSNVKYGGSSTVPTAAGTYAVTADFAPTDSTDYNSLTGAAAGSFIINKATPTVTVANSPVTYNGSAQAATVNGSVSGTVSNVKYGGSSTVPTAAGTYAVTADFAPTDNTDYNNLTGAAAGNFVINKATPVITWSNPADITYGTALSGTQLNATSGGVAGNYVYTPASGTVLNAGSGQTLSVQFTPSDTTDYNTPTATTATINVSQATLTYTANAASMTYGGTVPSLSGSVSGFVNGDTQGSATTGTLAFNTSATSGSAAGSYAINGSGLSAANYTFVQAAGNATALTIGTAAITITANADSKTYGQTKTYGSGSSAYTITSGTLKNSDAISTVTLTDTDSGGVATAAVGGTYHLTPSAAVFTTGSAANYTITYVTGLLTVNKGTPAISGISSQNISYGTASVSLSGTVSAGSGYPADGETVSVTINGTTQTPAIAGGAGGFTAGSFPTTLPPAFNPYTITYAYTGDANLNGVTNTSTALTVTGIKVPNLAYTNAPGVNRQVSTADLVAAGLVSSQGSPTYSITIPSGRSGHGGSVITDGSRILYMPSGTPSSDNFSYTVSDGVVSGTATVTITFQSVAGAQIDSSLIGNDGADHARFTFHGIPNTLYHVQRATVLSPANWANADSGVTTGADGSFLWTDTQTISALGNSVYYRISYP